jgi:hypothetical protein
MSAAAETEERREFLFIYTKRKMDFFRALFSARLLADRTELTDRPEGVK